MIKVALSYHLCHTIFVVLKRQAEKHALKSKEDRKLIPYDRTRRHGSRGARS